MKLFTNYIPTSPSMTFDEWMVKTFQIRSDIQINLDPVEQNIVNFVKAVCNQTGSTVRIAGGWVRDRLLGVHSKDIDLTIDNMSGIKFGEMCEKVAASNTEWSKNIGEANRNVKDDPRIQALGTTYIQMYGILVDLVNLRKEDYTEKHQEGKGRAPVISFGNPKDDAERRDLTINSIFYNINTGQVEDFTGRGLSDLGFNEHGQKVGGITLRTPLDPKTTFLDDAVRVLRVLRFYSRYQGSVLAPEILAAFQDPQVVDSLMRDYKNLKMTNKSVTNEMLGIEMMKIMNGMQPEKAVKVMYETGLLHQLAALGQELQPFNMPQRNPHHELDLISHTMRVLQHTNEFALKYKMDGETRSCMNMAALWHDIGKLDPRSHVVKPTGQYGYHGNPNFGKGEQYAPGVTRGVPHEDASAEAFENFARLMKLPNNITSKVSALVKIHMVPHSHMKVKDVNEKLYGFLDKMPKLWQAAYILSMADSMSKKEDIEKSRQDSELGRYEQNINTMNELSQKPLPVLLTGEDYIRLFPEIDPKTGFIEGLKKMVRDWQYKQPVLTKEEAIKRLNGSRPHILQKFPPKHIS